MAEPIQTVNHLVLEALDRYAAQVCFSVKSARLIQNITYRQFRKWVFRLSGYLQQQASQGDELLRVAIVARNSPEWMAAYVASLLAGVLVVPIRSSLPLHQAEYILRNTGTNLIIGHERDVALLLGYFQDRLPRLRRALFIRNTDKPILPDMNGNGNNGDGNNGGGNNGGGNNGGGNNGDKNDKTGENGAGFGNGKYSLGGVETHDLYSILNRPLTAEQAQAVRDAALNLPGHEPAAVFYTPASDGKLRGLVFSLEQGRLTLESMADWFELDEDDLGYTPPHPLSDFAGLHAALHYLVSGVPNTLATGRETSFEELQHYSPTVTLTNPYVFEHIYLKVMEEMGQMPRSSRQVFQWALTVGKDYHAAGLNASPELSESYRRADMTFFSNIRGMLGGRLHRLYSTGAPLSQQWLDFAEAIGLAPLNVYSSSRAGGFPAASPVNERVTGSCGQITPGYQIRIADDGEILVRSRAVALGEWLANGRVRPLVDADGWLHTGDLGRFDSDGNLYLTGHKTAPLILATGRKVNPGPIEEHLTASPFIKHAMIYGEGRRYLSALIVPDFKAIAAIVAESASTESTPTGSTPTDAVPTKPHAVDEDTFPNAAPVAQAAASPTQAASPSPDPQAEHGESDPQLAADGLADDSLADDSLADDSLADDSLADSSPDITLRQVAQAQGRLTAQAVSDFEPIGAPHHPAPSLGAGSGNATDITAGVIPRDVLARLSKLSTRDLSVKNPAMVDLIEQVVRLVNVNLDDWEQIERFRLIKNLNRNGGKTAKKQIPPTHVETHDREEIAGAYTAEIEAMYPTAMPFAKKQVTQVKVDPEHLRQLVEKEGILDAWMNDAGIEFLLELARQKQIDAPSMVNIAETIAAISQMQNELRPLSTAFLVGNPTRIARYLPESALQLRQYDHIRRMRRIVIGLSKIVDGQVMAFALDKYGFLRGIHRLDVDMDVSGSDLTGTHYRLMANISRRCDSVVFSIPRGGRQVRVFSDGRLAGRYVNGSWLPEGKTSIDQAVIRLAERKEYDLPLLRRLIRCAFRMSELNQGAIFLLGDAATILERSDESEIQNVATIINMPVSSLSDDELIAFAKEDGATVVDTSGELRGCMVLLRPAAATQAQIGPGKGARHSSAAKMSAETDCIAITVSQDGPITVYDGGQRVIAL